MPYQFLNIWDLDLTLTTKHTFKEFQLKNYLTAPFFNTYITGKNQEGLLKKNLPFNSEESLNVVATYHNNHFFVAGLMAAILKKELILKEVLYSKANPATAIACYNVEGSDIPFFISFLPQHKEDYNSVVNNLKGKNEQIIFLMQLLLERKLITDDAEIDFYDDTFDYLEQAKSLPRVNCHHVDPRDSSFSCLEKFVSSNDSKLTSLAKKKFIDDFSKPLNDIFQKGILLLEKEPEAYEAAMRLHLELTVVFLQDRNKDLTQDKEPFYEKVKGLVERAAVLLKKHAGWEEILNEVCQKSSDLLGKKPSFFSESSNNNDERSLGKLRGFTI